MFFLALAIRSLFYIDNTRREVQPNRYPQVNVNGVVAERETAMKNCVAPVQPVYRLPAVESSISNYEVMKNFISVHCDHFTANMIPRRLASRSSESRRWSARA